MLTMSDQQELAALKMEWQSYTLLAEEFPKKQEFRKLADSLELMIINIESDNRYV